MYSILHVEDDRDYADVIQLHLQRCARQMGNCGLEFHTVETVNGASSSLSKSGYDCILCDYQLPDGTGLDVLDIHHDGNCSCPIIFLTGQGDEQVARNAFVNGVNDYFTKDMGVAGYDRLYNSIMTQMQYSAMEARTEQVTQELREKERLAGTYLDVASVLIIAMDTDGTITLINKYGHDEIFGGDCIGTTLCSHIPDEGRQKVASILHTVRAGEPSCVGDIEFSIQSKQGTLRLMRWNFMPYADTEGTIKAVLCSAQDITEETMAKKMLIRERDKFLFILEALDIGVYIIDPSYGIEYVNPAMRSFFGNPASKKCYEYLHNRSTPCENCPNAYVFMGNTVKRKNKYPTIGKCFSLTELPIFNDDGTMSKLELFYPE